jgi:hypothetical protein
MPIEIRELIFKATIVQESGGAGAAQSVAGAGNNDSSPNEELIKTCVEKVIEIIKEKNGR